MTTGKPFYNAIALGFDQLATMPRGHADVTGITGGFMLVVKHGPDRYTIGSDEWPHFSAKQVQTMITDRKPHAVTVVTLYDPIVQASIEIDDDDTDERTDQP